MCMVEWSTITGGDTEVVVAATFLDADVESDETIAGVSLFRLFFAITCGVCGALCCLLLFGFLLRSFRGVSVVVASFLLFRLGFLRRVLLRVVAAINVFKITVINFANKHVNVHTIHM